MKRPSWYRPWPVTLRGKVGVDALVDMLASSGVEGAVLIPGSDPWVLPISELPPSRSPRIGLWPWKSEDST